MANRFKKRYGLGVQSIGPRPQPPASQGGKTAVGALSGAASGVAAGAAGGPVGMAIGGLVGGLTSLFKSGAEKKANEKQYQANLAQFKTDSFNNIQSGFDDPSTVARQGNQAAKGLFYAEGTKDIEVERDELVFTKTAIGKYVLKADFQGGKTHNKGGEDFKAAEGDIIFPGKDRKKVMKAFTDGNDPVLEGMRARLPKDTQAGKAQNGLDTDPLKPGSLEAFNATVLEGMQNQYKQAPGTSEDSLLKFMQPYTNMISRNRKGIIQGAKDFYNFGNTSAIGTNEQNNLVRPGEKLQTQAQQNAQLVGAQNEIPLSTDFSDALNFGDPSKQASTNAVDPRIASRARTAIPGNSANAYTPLNLGKPSLSDGPAIEAHAAPPVAGANTEVAGGKLAGALGKIPFGAIGQLGAAAMNLFPGEAEVQNTPNIRLQREQYKDTSAGLRRQSQINERVQRNNARNLSGGNVQNMLANQRVAGIQNLRNLQGINTQEFGRAQGVASRNVGRVNKERQMNSRFGIMDEQVNAQNRAARTNQINSGVAQIGTLAGQFGQDSARNKSQEEMLKTLNSMGGFEVLPDGSIRMKQTNA